jgi:hypothetical protein
MTVRRLLGTCLSHDEKNSPLKAHAGVRYPSGALFMFTNNHGLLCREDEQAATGNICKRRTQVDV